MWATKPKFVTCKHHADIGHALQETTIIWDWQGSCGETESECAAEHGSDVLGPALESGGSLPTVVRVKCLGSASCPRHLSPVEVSFMLHAVPPLASSQQE